MGTLVIDVREKVGTDDGNNEGVRDGGLDGTDDEEIDGEDDGEVDGATTSIWLNGADVSETGD